MITVLPERGNVQISDPEYNQLCCLSGTWSFTDVVRRAQSVLCCHSVRAVILCCLLQSDIRCCRSARTSKFAL